MANDIEKTNGQTPEPEGDDFPLSPAEDYKEPKGELELLREKYEDLLDRHLRLMAEYDNFRKRSLREKDEIYGNATAAVIAKLLPVQDNFDRARGHDCASEEFAKGFEMIDKDFSGILASLGVEAFGQPGEPFDPEKHHAVMHIEDDSLGENVVAQALQKGYRMGDKILRPAMVQTAN